jgi:hypothetical protein
MSSKEGSQLIIRHLRLGDTENPFPGALAEELGGLPLALAHFSGYILRCRQTLPEVLPLQRNWQETEGIWTSENASTFSQYHETFATVWDFAFRDLSENSRKLLHILSFPHPDLIPEELLLADHDALPQDPQASRNFR